MRALSRPGDMRVSPYLNSIAASAVLCLSLFVPAPAAAQWVTTFRNASCIQNGVPELCDVYFNRKEMTWKVLWKGYKGTRYYTMRGGNYFVEKDATGRDIGTWVLNQKQQTLESDGETIKIFDIR